VQYSQGGSFIRRDGDTVPGDMIWDGTQKWNDSVTLANSKILYQLESGGTARSVIRLEPDNILRLGDSNIVLRLRNASSLLNNTPTAAGQIATIVQGTYTGDGATSQTITGTGFLPAYVKIWAQGATTEAQETYETTTNMIDDDGTGLAFVQNYTATGLQARYRDDSIITLAVGSFTVDDDGADSHPNKDGQVYNYYALGA
jgi:hypothetical protein